ncbi:MAG: hypothetical protein SLRJCFUN_002630, partial [Candidatus Fervidibacter sp.]
RSNRRSDKASACFSLLEWLSATTGIATTFRTSSLFPRMFGNCDCPAFQWWAKKFWDGEAPAEPRRSANREMGRSAGRGKFGLTRGSPSHWASFPNTLTYPLPTCPPLTGTTSCPPNSWRKAATTLLAKLSGWRERWRKA